MPVTRSQVVAEARSWLDTPFRHQARIKGVGTDCVNLPVGVYEVFGFVREGLDIPRNYSLSPDGSLVSFCERYMQRIAKSAMKPADVVVVSVDVFPQHVGIVGNYRHGGLSIIHAANQVDGKGKVVESRLVFHPRAFRFVAAFTVPGVIDG